jgi:hypothetical protein
MTQTLYHSRLWQIPPKSNHTSECASPLTMGRLEGFQESNFEHIDKLRSRAKPRVVDPLRTNTRAHALPRLQRGNNLRAGDNSNEGGSPSPEQSEYSTAQWPCISQYKMLTLKQPQANPLKSIQTESPTPLAHSPFPMRQGRMPHRHRLPTCCKSALRASHPRGV